MAIKTVLVHLAGTKRSAVQLDVAARLATAHDAHLVGLHVIPAFYSIAGPYDDAAGVAIAEVRKEYEGAAHRTADGIEASFRQHVEGAGLMYEWRCVEGAVSDVVALHARYADLTVIGQEGQVDDGEHGAGHLVGDVVVSAGRPVLAVPYAGTFAGLSERALIAWNGSREAARAVADALPVLERTKQVIVLSINPPEGDHIPGADISAHLARHGVKAEAHSTVAEDISVGDIMLSRAADWGVDLIVMGAYGHSRLHEFVLGGATRHLLNHMTVPVLLSH